MKTVAVTGATGFVGQFLMARLRRRDDVRLRLLTRNPQQLNGDRHVEGSRHVEILRGDLLDQSAVAELVDGVSWVVHLAYQRGRPAHDNLAASRNLSNACSTAGVQRLVHCSTAVVVGRTKSARIDESAVCRPADEYEQTKLAIERVLLDSPRGHKVVILRPTAVFGPHGQNLMKLARQLTSGRPLANYVRSCLLRHRSMNLVSVRNVAAALEFLMDAPSIGDGEVFLVSDDDDPRNHYGGIEEALKRGFGLPGRRLPRLPVPKWAVSSLLKFRGRHLANPDSRFDDSKLRRAGFRKVVSLEEALAEFAGWFGTGTEPAIAASGPRSARRASDGARMVHS